MLPAHINVKEMQAVLLALEAFHITGDHVLVQSDNTTVVAYLVRQGGCHSPTLDALARRVVQWCMLHGMTLSAVHVAGADNCRADLLSRPGQAVVPDRMKSVEWALSPLIAGRIFTHWGVPMVDLFATALNRKVPVFCSRVPHPLALRAPALQLPWVEGLYYMFPPLSLTLQCLCKIGREEAEVIAILPWWPNRGWFPLLLDLMVDLPILLPLRDYLLKGLDGLPHPSLKSLHLAAWRLSGNSCRRREFLKGLPKRLASPFGPAPRLYTSRNGDILYAGVLTGISIPFIAL